MRPKTPAIFIFVISTIITNFLPLSGIHAAQAADSKSSGRVISGQIISPYGPVEKARVRIAGDEKFALTDRQGRFELQASHLPARSVRITAGKQGYFNNGQVTYPMGDAGKIALNPLYLQDRDDYRFISPVTCSRCHIKVSRYWDKSKMAHTSANYKVLNMYYGTDVAGRKDIGPGFKRDNLQSQGNCAVCHAPSAAISRFGSNDLQTALWSPRTEWEGVSCDYCHKVRKVIKNQNAPSGYKALLQRQTPARGNTILVFGPYDDVVNPAMAASYSPLYEKGLFCATCHSHRKQLPNGQTWDRKKIYGDAEWKGFELKDDSWLPVQTTYQEWKKWQADLGANDPNKGKKCQDCHMSWRKEMLPYDEYVVDQQARNMWGTKRKPGSINPHHFDGGTETQLKTSLSMEVEGEVVGDRLKVKIFITNTNGGHWVPTGETMRSVMLIVNATDSAGRPLKMAAGERLPDWTGAARGKPGHYAGLPGAAFARVLADDKGNLHVPFWRATHIVTDNRIRPKTTRTISFEFRIRDLEDEATVEARLLYRPVITQLAAIKNWPVKDIPITTSVW